MSAPEGIRTPNLLIRSQMLYPLSYGRMFYSVVHGCVSPAEARGFEPPVAFKGDNSLAVSPIRPLWHASRRCTADPTEYTGATPPGKARFGHP
jgi:hypothetical protein